MLKEWFLIAPKNLYKSQRESLLAALKRKVDESDLMGGYFLIGSQNFSVLKSISESMAGRVALFHLDPFTPLEMTDSGQRTSWISDYLADPIALSWKSL